MKSVMINGTEYELKKMTPGHIAKIANILGRLSVEGRKWLKKEGFQSEQMLWGVLAAVDGDDLVDAAAALIGCERKFAEDNFDLLWVSQAIQIQMELSNITALINSFTSGSFLTPN